MIKKTIKKIFKEFGLDLKKATNTPHPLAFVKNLHIKCVLDIGANIGEFSRDIRPYLEKGAKIFAFEPLSECFSALLKNRAGDKDFVAMNFALGNENDTITIHKSSYLPSSSFLEMKNLHEDAFPHSKGGIEEKVDIKRLDDVAKTLDIAFPMLIKIDVQGFEDRVIAGGNDIFAKAKVILIENSFFELYAGQPLFDDIYKTLTALGFSYRGSISKKYHPKTGEILFEDSIFIKN